MSHKFMSRAYKAGTADALKIASNIYVAFIHDDEGVNAPEVLAKLAIDDAIIFVHEWNARIIAAEKEAAAKEGVTEK